VVDVETEENHGSEEGGRKEEARKPGKCEPAMMGASQFWDRLGRLPLALWL
jgi:hypothetical protein